MSKLEGKAVKNLTVIRRKSQKDTKVKEGKPTHSEKHSTLETSGLSNSPIVGVNIGTTLNMGDYESLRIDCWLTDFVREGETHEQAFLRVREIASKQVIETAQSMK